MRYALSQTPLSTQNEALIVGFFSDQKISSDWDKKTKDLLSSLIEKAQEPGDIRLQSQSKDSSMLVVNCGPKAAFTLSQLQKRIGELTDFLIQQRLRTVTLCFPQMPDLSPDKQLEQMILKLDHQLYQFLDFKTKNGKANALESVSFYLPGATEKTIHTAEAIALSVSFTRNLGNMPANICTPTYLGEQAEALAKQYDTLTCKVLGPLEMKKLGMNTLLAVSQGSVQPPRLIDLRYQGGGKAAPIVLVGKGITFDSGGLSLKLANFMDEMKYDMCGAATVLGVLKACAMLKLPINLIGIIASAENLPSGSAVKCGDVVTSMSGQTIEIVNTDAEGRLVLADALTYAEQFNPEFVIDIATLTGAVIVALGAVSSGLMTKDEELAKLLYDLSLETNDKVWRLPLDEEYQKALDSPVADMLNSTFDRTAGSVVAASFLARFTSKYRWAHLDVAGTAWVSGKNRNATGRPVYLLTQLIRHVANSR